MPWNPFFVPHFKWVFELHMEHLYALSTVVWQTWQISGKNCLLGVVIYGDNIEILPLPLLVLSFSLGNDWTAFLRVTTRISGFSVTDLKSVSDSTSSTEKKICCQQFMDIGKNVGKTLNIIICQKSMFFANILKLEISKFSILLSSNVAI